MKDIGHTFGCVDPCAHSLNFHGTDIDAVILEIKHDGTVLWKGREVESDADFRAAMMEVKRHLCGSVDMDARVLSLRGELDFVTKDRDALQAEVKRLTAAVMAFTVMAVACVAVLLIVYLIWGGA
jgi:hypothetical protein